MSGENEHSDRPPGFEALDESALAAFRAFRDAVRVNAQVMHRRFAASGAHMGQAACLRVLATRDGITQRDMAEILQISRPSVTAMVQAAEKAGLVDRRADESDQRLTRVYLTGEGRRLAAELGDVLAAYIDEVFGPMTEDDRLELARLLGQVRENIERATSAFTTEEEATEE